MRSRDGAAAIEFAILAIPFFLLVFATIETFVAYAGEQLLANAVDNMGRKIRTGQITSSMSKADFRSAFCDEISVMLSCSKGSDQKLWLDVRSFSSFADMPIGVTMKEGHLDTSDFGYSPGTAKSYNMVRAYYRWQIVTDLVRPYVSNERPTDGSTPDYIMVATTAFANENYP